MARVPCSGSQALLEGAVHDVGIKITTGPEARIGECLINEHAQTLQGCRSLRLSQLQEGCVGGIGHDVSDHKAGSDR